MPMLGYTEDERQKDIKKMKKFIENNPYPEYDKVIDIIRKDKIFRKNLWICLLNMGHITING